VQDTLRPSLTELLKLAQGSRSKLNERFDDVFRGENLKQEWINRIKEWLESGDVIKK
jgi:hypothetical protein